ncbi:MAG: YraN family protein [Spirochaetia bacterium]|nr:YraN family protein [Spirochaetia bacterium]
MNRYEKGKSGEDKACKYLEKKGYTVIARNYRSKKGEIDIVAKDGSFLVFVEVKSWGSVPFSEAGFSIGRLKKSRMIKTVKQYLFENQKSVSGLDIRFDLIFINPREGTLTHSENAIGEVY